MRIKLHDDVEGHKSGETVDVPKERAEWYLLKGYASHPDHNDDEHPETNVLAKHDPTLAANVEAKPNLSAAEQSVERTGNPQDVDPDPVVPTTFTSNKTPVELTNGKGNPEKAEKGKDQVEDKQSDTDADKAPEANPELVEQRAAVADTAEEGAAKADEAGDKVEAKADVATTTTDAASDPAQKAATKARGSKG